MRTDCPAFQWLLLNGFGLLIYTEQCNSKVVWPVVLENWYVAVGVDSKGPRAELAL